MDKSNKKEPFDFQKAVRTGQVVRGRVRMAQKGTYEGAEDCLIVEVAGKKVTVSRSEIVLPVNQSLSSLVGTEIDLIITLAPEDVPLIFGSQKAVIAMKQKPFLDKLKAGETMEGTIVRLLDYGGYIALGDCGLNGLLKNTDFSDGVTTIRDVYRVGDKIDVQLLKITEQGNIHLQVPEKYVSGDAWSIEDFSPGQTVYGSVVAVKTYGVYVRIAPNLDALCALPDFIDGINEGQKVILKIKSVKEEEQRVRGVVKRVLD